MIRALSRTHLKSSPFYTYIAPPEFNTIDSWLPILDGIDVVVHLAGLAHVPNSSLPSTYPLYFDANVDFTIQLGRAASRSSVKRFIFVSSVKVNGETSSSQATFACNSPSMPLDSYALSKHVAEIALEQIAYGSELELVIIRPPLVYGPGVKGNLSRLISYVNCGYPLPFGALTRNKRSIVSVANLVDFIKLCLSHEQAPGGFYFVTDGVDYSTADLISMIRSLSGSASALLRLPEPLLHFAF